MPDDASLTERLVRWVLPLALAILGAGAKHARECQMGQQVTLGDFIARLIIAGFAGAIVLLLCREYGVSEYMTGVITGIAGYAGAEAIDAVRRFVVGRYKP